MNFLHVTRFLAGIVSCSAMLYEIVPLNELNLNREGRQLIDELLDFPEAAMGFTWNDEDDSTLKWRPQGIAGVTVEGMEFIAVSWYGRDEENYSDRGVRISFADVTDFGSIMYRHVLLVDEEFNTFTGMHAGGVLYSEGFLHVPDSRSGTKMVYTFSLGNIMYVPEKDRALFYNYAYIIQRSSSYSVPITPSFLSYDRDRREAVLGSFYQCQSTHADSAECLSSDNNRLMWYALGQVSESSDYCYPFFSEMQGAVTAGNPLSTVSTKPQVLWSTSSYGSSHDSHLHVTYANPSSCVDSGTNSTSSFRTVVYPPGLEDIHISDYGSKYEPYIWIVTEFGANDGNGNRRVVFAADMRDLMP